MSDENTETTETPEVVNDAPVFTPPPLPTQPTGSALISAPSTPEPARSMFKSDVTAYATIYHAHGFKWFFNGPSEDAKAYVNAMPARLAALFGMTESEFAAAPITTPEQSAMLSKENESTWDIYLDSVLGGWTLPKDCNSETRRDLWPDLKRELFDYAQSFFTFGFSEAQFRKSRN